jgi:hypothetical protein
VGPSVREREANRWAPLCPQVVKDKAGGRTFPCFYHAVGLSWRTMLFRLVKLRVKFSLGNNIEAIGWHLKKCRLELC